LDIRQLSQLGFVSVNYDSDTRKVVTEAMSSWRLFTKLPEEKKRLITEGDRVNDFGYMRRQDKVGTADDKELFHAVGRNMEILKEKASKIDDPHVTDFIDKTDHLIEEVNGTVMQFAREVEKRHGLEHFAGRVDISSPNWTFRYLHYFPGSSILAHPHVDRGGFTLHLYESEEGGQYLDSFSKLWIPWPINGDQTIIFPSMGLQHRSQGRIKALCHRVLPSFAPDREGRYALVAFIDFRHTHRYNDDTANGGRRLQEFEPGFNYDMPFAEFDKLFVSV
jgi:isopenicillin N synthase-like dioxygenase